MGWKMGLLIILTLGFFVSLVRPEGCGGFSLPNLLVHLAVFAEGFVSALVIFRDEIRGSSANPAGTPG